MKVLALAIVVKAFAHKKVRFATAGNPVAHTVNPIVLVESPIGLAVKTALVVKIVVMKIVLVEKRVALVVMIVPVGKIAADKAEKAGHNE